MKVEKLLKEIGLKRAEKLGSWDEYIVLVGTSDDKRCIGLPQFILLKGDDARWATPEETIELMNIFCI